MKTFNLTYILLFLSKTDPAIYSSLPQNVKWTRTGLGLFVLFTGVFAFATSGYFVRTLFVTYNEVSETLEVSTIGWIASLVFGLFWSGFIMNIEREVVSAPSKWAAILRLPLALLIGLTIAIPLEVQLFSERINKELTVSGRQENEVYEQRRDSVMREHKQRIATLEDRIVEQREKMAEWAKAMEAEVVGRVIEGSTGISGEGPAYRAAKRNLELHKGFAEDYEKRLARYTDSFEQVATQEKERLSDNKVQQSYDFISQYLKMKEMQRNNHHLANLGFGIMLLLILVETIPAIMKILKKDDEYDTLLAVNSSVHKQMANRVANFAMKKIEKDNDPDMISKDDHPYSPKKVKEFIDKNSN